MKVVYPIIIQKTNDKNLPYFVKITDVDGMTQGKSVSDAIEMARDYIGLMVMDLQDDNKQVPKSNYVVPKVNADEIATLVDVDITKYRKLHDTKVVKKTLTIPNYLNQLGKENHVNFSEILTSALKVQLKV